MNELNIPIENAYYYETEKFCYTLMEGFHIQISPWDNEKGYCFHSHPCFCYSSCCKDLREQFGDFKDEPMDLLLSERRLAFLNKIIIDRDFSSCKGCPKYVMRHDSGFWNEVDFRYLFGEKTGGKLYDMYNKRHLDTIFPRGVFLNLGACCNLKCKTCRNKFITTHFDLSDDEIKQLVFIAKHTDMLALGGDGEFFMNKNYTRILNADLHKDSSLKSIIIMTNGTMFTEKRWNEIPESSRGLIKEIKISIDAATPETYAKVRGPIGWKMLMNNMPFIQKAAKENGIKLSSTFTISKYNVQDVYKFYEFARSLGFSTVMFQFARDLFHPETGCADDYIIRGPEHDEIIKNLCDLRSKEGYDKVVVE